MSTALFCTALLLLWSTPLAARELFLGIKAGVNASSRSYDTPINSEGLAGITAGVSATNPFSEVVGARLELLYSVRGDRVTSTVNGVQYQSTQTVSYIDAPLVLIVRPPSVLGVHPNVFAGPVFSVHLDTKTDGDYGETVHRYAPRATDIGVTFGGGFTFQLGSALLGIDARYTTGLQGSLQNYFNEAPPKAVPGMFTVMAGYFFRL